MENDKNWINMINGGIDNKYLKRCSVIIVGMDSSGKVSESVNKLQGKDILLDKYVNIDKDGAITSYDAYKVLNLYAQSSVDGGTMPTEEEIRLGDVNEDGVLDGRDASCILTYVTNVAVSDGEREMTIQEFLASRS